VFLVCLCFCFGCIAQTLVVTSSNTAPNNRLLVYSSSGELIQNISTDGAGGVTGNAGGIATTQSLLAVVNFGSNTVSLFHLLGDKYHFVRTLSAVGPVSVAFGNQHLYVLGNTSIYSFDLVRNTKDGEVRLFVADGSAAQVGVLKDPDQLVISEKSNVIETVQLTKAGAVTGTATLVRNIPSNVNTPFGLATSDNNAYVTIAHANEISLVRNGTVLTTVQSAATSTGVNQVAPCWAALSLPFLFTTNPGSQSVSRYAVYGQNIVADAAVAYQFSQSVSDIAVHHGTLGVVSLSTVAVFSVDEDGNLSILANITTGSSTTNGVAVVAVDNGSF